MVLMYGLCMFLALFGGFRDQSVYRFGKVFMVYETEHDGVSNHFIFYGLFWSQTCLLFFAFTTEKGLFKIVFGI